MGASIGTPERRNDKTYEILVNNPKIQKPLEMFEKKIIISATLYNNEDTIAVNYGPKPTHTLFQELKPLNDEHKAVVITKIYLIGTKSPLSVDFSLKITIPTKSFYVNYENELKGTSSHRNESQDDADLKEKSDSISSELAKSENKLKLSKNMKDSDDVTVASNGKSGWINELLNTPPRPVEFLIPFNDNYSLCGENSEENKKILYVHPKSKFSKMHAGFNPDILKACTMYDTINSSIVHDVDWELHTWDSVMYKLTVNHCINPKSLSEDECKRMRQKQTQPSTIPAKNPTQDRKIKKKSMSSANKSNPGDNVIVLDDFSDIIKPIEAFDDEESSALTLEEQKKLLSVRYIKRKTCDDIRRKILNTAVKFNYINTQSIKTKPTIPVKSDETIRERLKLSKSITMIAEIMVEYHVVDLMQNLDVQ